MLHVDSDSAPIIIELVPLILATEVEGSAPGRHETARVANLPGRAHPVRREDGGDQLPGAVGLAGSGQRDSVRRKLPVAFRTIVVTRAARDEQAR